LQLTLGPTKVQVQQDYYNMNWFEFFQTTDIDQEQIAAVNKLESMYDAFVARKKRKPTKLYIAHSEELQSYLMWASMALNLRHEFTSKPKSYLE
jgi:hypothetical protein